MRRRVTAAAIIGVLVSGVTGLSGREASATNAAPPGSQSAPVPVFVFTQSTDPSTEEYVIGEFKKELPKRVKDFPFSLVDSREQARVVLEIHDVIEVCGFGVPDALVGVRGTLTVGTSSTSITASGACSPWKKHKYRPLGKRLAQELARWGEQHRDDLLALPEPRPGPYIGDHGYRIEFPEDYRAYKASTDAGTEVVLFVPSGTEPALDESQYAVRRIVRLEAWRAMTIDLEKWRAAVSATLDKNNETHTISDVDVGRPGFQVHITSPKEIRQLFVRGAEVMYLFTGADEELLYMLARGIKEGAGSN